MKNNFIRKFIGFSIGPFLGAFISFITIPITTYFINPDEYGKASMFLLLQMVLGSILFLGIDQAYTREYHTLRDKKKLFQNALLIPLIFALAIFVCTVIFSKEISLLLFNNENYRSVSIFTGVMILFMVLERFLLLSIRMAEKALEYSIFNIIIKLCSLIITIIFLLFVRRDFLAVVYSTIISQIVGDIYLIFRYRNLLYLKKHLFSKELINKMLVFGLPIFVAVSISSLLNTFDRVSLRIWSNYYQIGIFTATLKIASVLAIIQTSFTTFWTPTAYRWYSEEKNIKYFKLVSDGILLVMTIIFFGIIFLKKLIVMLLSSRYIDAQYIVGFLALQPIMYTVSETTSLGIVFSRKSYLSIWVGLSALVTNIGVNLLLVSSLGALGAAIATGLSYIVFFIIRTYFSNKNGMRFSTKKHIISAFILFGCAIYNSYESSYTELINVIFLLITLLIQISTIIGLYRFKKKRLDVNG